ncbi:MAG: rhodanese-like domain-containing protein [Ignavibacteria bacterium]|nr:rhodanese-like domain-containing protein [Ignavibacteria bacterium]
MIKFKNLFLLLFIPTLLLLVSCSKDDSGTNPPPPTTISAEKLASYIEANGDYMHNFGSFVITAADYKTQYVADPSKIYTIDIRSAADFNAKHLKGAKNVTLDKLYEHIKGLNLANYNKVVVVCYSGQTACFGVGAVRSMYSKADGDKIVALKWGMSSIDSSFAQNYWLAKIGNTRATQFVNTDSPAKPAKGSMPTLTSEKTGKDLLEERMNQILKDGFNITITESAVYSNLSNYFILNYWPVAAYKDPGHIDGAINYDPAGKPFQLANDLKTLPTNKPIVFYCYTGQTSAYWGAYLKMLGYDVKTLVYGANSMIYDKMKGNANIPQANVFIPANEIKGYKDLLE